MVLAPKRADNFFTCVLIKQWILNYLLDFHLYLIPLSINLSHSVYIHPALNSPSKEKLNKAKKTLYSSCSHHSKKKKSLLSSPFLDLHSGLILSLHSRNCFLSSTMLQLLSNIHKVVNFLHLETSISEMSLIPTSFAFPLTSPAISFSLYCFIFHYLISSYWNSPGLGSVFYSFSFDTISLRNLICSQGNNYDLYGLLYL